MNTNYLNKKVYARCYDYIYEVKSVRSYSYCDYLLIELELVAGIDYINPDESDVQGWVPADRFVEDLQYESVNQYFIVESMVDALRDNGYNVMDEKDVPNFIKNK